MVIGLSLCTKRCVGCVDRTGEGKGDPKTNAALKSIHTLFFLVVGDSLLHIQLHEVTSVHPTSVAILKSKITVRRRRDKD
jgi:hypothetical protein